MPGAGVFLIIHDHVGPAVVAVHHRCVGPLGVTAFRDSVFAESCRRSAGQHEEDAPGDVDERLAHLGLSSETTGGHVNGVPARSVCGAVVVPSRDPRLFPACPE